MNEKEYKLYLEIKKQREKMEKIHSMELDDMAEEIYNSRNVIDDLQNQRQAYKQKEDKLREYITNKTHFMTENGIQYMCNSDELLQILNEGDKK